jgi:hypothetical protein
MSKIRASAKGETCTFNLPGICNFNPETVVLCHAPHPDKGMGIKSPDTWAAYGCSSCHDVMDGRTSGFFVEHEFVTLRLQKVMAWYPAILETQRRLIAKGLMPK